MSTRTLFEELANGADSIAVAEFREILEDAGLMDSIIKDAISAVDPDKTRKITADGFQAIKDLRTGIVERALRGARACAQSRGELTPLQESSLFPTGRSSAMMCGDRKHEKSELILTRAHRCRRSLRR